MTRADKYTLRCEACRRLPVSILFRLLATALDARATAHALRATSGYGGRLHPHLPCPRANVEPVRRWTIVRESPVRHGIRNVLARPVTVATRTGCSTPPRVPGPRIHRVTSPAETGGEGVAVLAEQAIASLGNAAVGRGWSSSHGMRGVSATAVAETPRMP